MDAENVWVLMIVSVMRVGVEINAVNQNTNVILNIQIILVYVAVMECV